MNFEEQLKLFVFADDITRVRKQIKDNIVLFEDLSFAKEFLLHISELIKDGNDYKNMKQFIYSNDFDTDYLEIYQALKKYLNENKFEINAILIYIIELFYSFKEQSNLVNQVELNNLWEILTSAFKIGSSNDEIFQKIDNLIIKFNKTEILFAYTLRQIPINEIHEFLEFHQKNNDKDYESFLKYFLLEYEPLLLEKTRKVVNDYLEPLIVRQAEPKIEKIITMEVAESKFPETHPQADQLLNVMQAAKFLNLAVPTLYTKTSKNTIPFMKRGKKLYFKESELRAWLEAGKRKSNSELDIEAELYISRKGAL